VPVSRPPPGAQRSSATAWLLYRVIGRLAGVVGRILERERTCPRAEAQLADAMLSARPALGIQALLYSCTPRSSDW
jgi:hypothetical protein